MNLNIGLSDLLQIEQILNSGEVVNGRYTEKIETWFKKTFGVKYAIACANCTSGLVIAAQAAGWYGNRVAAPTFTWPSTHYAIKMTGGTILHMDINPKTWCMDTIPKSADSAIVVDTFGNQASLETDKPVIYDAAHGYGLPDLGHRGIAEVVSLAMTKAVTGMQGGIILTNDGNLDWQARAKVKLYAKITEINAYIALIQAQKFNEDLQRRFKAVDRYCDLLDDPYDIQDVPTSTNLSVFAIKLPSMGKRNRAVEALIELDMEIKIYYSPQAGGLKHTDELFSRILALPTWEGIERHIPEICEAINNA
jgi:dTDP-4-amino-4,6-dideoxygalactose transaminase